MAHDTRVRPDITRLCVVCDQPADGPTAPIRPGHPEAGRIALRHDDCYRRLVAGHLPAWITQ
jgi:hypothetical protein